MRGGAAGNVYVVPEPSILNFGTTTLLTAACCIHAILSLISMWNKVVTRRWMLRWRRTDDTSLVKTSTDPTNMTPTERINDRIGYFLSMVAVPVFGGAGVAIVIVGELNFFSPQVRYQTEPMACVGKSTPSPTSRETLLLILHRSMGAYCWHGLGHAGLIVSSFGRRR
jgi:hypothetical protein